MKFMRLYTNITTLIIGLSLVSSIGFTKPRQFYFAQISDIHFGIQDSAERMLKVVDAINNTSLEIGFVADTGDVFNGTVLDESVNKLAKDAFAKFKMPVFHVAGNHDIMPGSTFGPSVLAYQKAVGPLYGQTEYHGIIMIFFCTESLDGSVKLDGYESMIWLRKQLKLAGRKPVVVFTHRPPTKDFYANSLHETWPASELKQFEKLVNAYNVKAVISGHYHRAEQHWIGKVPVFVASPIANLWGRESGYRIYEYVDGKISYRTQYPK